MGERLLCKQEVVGSIPSASTRSSGVEAMERLMGLRSVGRSHNTVTWARLGRRPSLALTLPHGSVERDHGQREEDM